MKKYWYVIKQQGEYPTIGCCYGQDFLEIAELIELMQEFCKARKGELALVAEKRISGSALQVYPILPTEESVMFLEMVHNFM